MDGEGYNGWKNYETWAVALWLDNDPTEYEVTRSKARAFSRGSYGGRSAEGAFADWLSEYVEETRPDLGASLWSDLLSAAFSKVDWYEIAENYLEEVSENAV